MRWELGEPWLVQAPAVDNGGEHQGQTEPSTEDHQAILPDEAGRALAVQAMAGPSGQCDNWLVAEHGLLFGDRIWFVDVRTPARRMAVTTHPEDGVAVISLWHGDSCTATFRLPRRDAARFVDALAQGLSVKDASAD